MSDPFVNLNVDKASDRLWSVMKLPVQILLTGLSILFLFWLASYFYVPLLKFIAAGITVSQTAENVRQHPVVDVALAIFMFVAGWAFSIFLWMIVFRYFALIIRGKLTGDEVSHFSALKLGWWPSLSSESNARASSTAVVEAVSRLSAYGESQILELVSAGKIDHLFPFHPVRPDTLPPDTVEESELVQASLTPLSRERRTALLESSMPVGWRRSVQSPGPTVPDSNEKA